LAFLLVCVGPLVKAQSTPVVLDPATEALLESESVAGFQRGYLICLPMVLFVLVIRNYRKMGQANSGF